MEMYNEGIGSRRVVAWGEKGVVVIKLFPTNTKRFLSCDGRQAWAGLTTFSRLTALWHTICIPFVMFGSLYDCTALACEPLWSLLLFFCLHFSCVSLLTGNITTGCIATWLHLIVLAPIAVLGDLLAAYLILRQGDWVLDDRVWLLLLLFLTFFSLSHRFLGTTSLPACRCTDL